jgi:hypothetical protein
MSRSSKTRMDQASRATPQEGGGDCAAIVQRRSAKGVVLYGQGHDNEGLQIAQSELAVSSTT